MAKDDSLTLDIAILGGGFAGVYCAKPKPWSGVCRRTKPSKWG
jgi:glycerol-3-phosphate dehydrogenase